MDSGDEYGLMFDQSGDAYTDEGWYLDPEGYLYGDDYTTTPWGDAWTQDEQGGYWDEQGGYYDPDGGYFDPAGNYYDAEGNYYQPGEGGDYQLVEGGGESGGLGGFGSALRGLFGQGGTIQGLSRGIAGFYKDNPLLGGALNYGLGRMIEGYDRRQEQAQQKQERSDYLARLEAMRNEPPRYVSELAQATTDLPATMQGYGRVPGQGERLLFNQQNPLAALRRAGSPISTPSVPTETFPGAVEPSPEAERRAYAGGTPGFYAPGGQGYIPPEAMVPLDPPTVGPAAPMLPATAPPPRRTQFLGRGALSYAHGGVVRGAGGGQDDLIPGMLSDGEYVMDAATVSALGDGSTAAGAQKLDTLRNEVRKHKATAEGRIPPRAKASASYMR